MASGKVKDCLTFGKVLTTARKKANLSQKQLAALIYKEDEGPISPQYLNDIEHDRRNPPSDLLIEQFAKVLNIPPEFLYFYAGELPPDIRDSQVNEKQILAAFNAFRRKIRDSK